MRDENDGGGVSPLDMAQGGTYSSPMYNFAGSIVDLTDTESLLYRLEANLAGEVIDEGGRRVKAGEPLLNSDGIKAVVGMVRSAGSQSTIMSDFDKDEIRVIMEYLNDTLCRDLLLNRFNYEIVNPSARSTIVFMANACCFAILKRGFEGGERRFWRGSQQEITFKGGEPSGKNRGGGFLGLFKR